MHLALVRAQRIFLKEFSFKNTLAMKVARVFLYIKESAATRSRGTLSMLLVMNLFYIFLDEANHQIG